MKEIDYTKIDGLCIKVIKYCNNVMDLETEFSCQGKSLGDDRKHSTRPYIIFLQNQGTLNKLQRLVESYEDTYLHRWILTYAPFQGMPRWKLEYSRDTMVYNHERLTRVWDTLLSKLMELNKFYNGKE